MQQVGRQQEGPNLQYGIVLSPEHRLPQEAHQGLQMLWKHAHLRRTYDNQLSLDPVKQCTVYHSPHNLKGTRTRMEQQGGGKLAEESMEHTRANKEISRQQLNGEYVRGTLEENG